MARNLTKLFICGTILALSVSPVLAQGRGVGGGVGGGIGGGIGGGAGMGAGAGMSGGANVGANMGGMNNNSGGQSNANIGAEGRANTNGPDAADRDFGTDRAKDRAASRASVGGNASAQANAASELGKLNAVHASGTARENANANSTVGSIATYESQMKAALAINNPTQRDAAIVAARQQLADNSNKQLTPGAVASIDNSLNIQGASPQLGTSP